MHRVNKFFLANWKVIIALCAGFFLIFYFIKNSNHNSSEPLLIKKGNTLFIPERSTLRNLLKIKKVQYSDEDYPLSFPAELQVNPKKLINIYPPFSGKINNINIDLGDYIHEGQLLVKIFSADLAQVYADWLKSRSSKTLAEEQLNRIKEVQKVGASALKEVEMAQSNYEMAYAEYRKAALKLKIFNEENVIDNDGILNIRTPIDGKVMNIFTSEGSFINDLNKPILSIAKLDSIWVSFCVREDLIQFIKKGQNILITVDAYPDKHYKSNIL